MPSVCWKRWFTACVSGLLVLLARLPGAAVCLGQTTQEDLEARYQ